MAAMVKNSMATTYGRLMLCMLVLAVSLYCLCNTDVTTLAQVLKQKRLYENQRGQLMNQQFNVDQTSFALQCISAAP